MKCVWWSRKLTNKAHPARPCQASTHLVLEEVDGKPVVMCRVHRIEWRKSKHIRTKKEADKFYSTACYRPTEWRK